MGTGPVGTFPRKKNLKPDLDPTSIKEARKKAYLKEWTIFSLPGSGEPLTAGITHEIFDGDTPVVQVSTLLLLKQEKKTVLRLILRFNTKLVNRLSGYGIERKKQKNFHLKYFIFLKKRHLKI